MGTDKKYIHYCWFGGRPLTKMAKKCIKSWKKYLPEYEIIRWDEKNANLEKCEFAKQAYEQRKWAFVADYTRVKALYEYGGIYFDTDMLITKDIAELKDKNFLGFEDSGYVNAAVWGVTKPHDALTGELLATYEKQTKFDFDKVYSFTIPIIVSKALEKRGLAKDNGKIQKLRGDIYVYPRDYFYPLSYDYQNNAFSDNTCMIHYCNGTWTSKNEKKDIAMIRKHGRAKFEKRRRFKQRIKAGLSFYKKTFTRTATLALSPVRLPLKKYAKIKRAALNLNYIANQIEQLGHAKYIVFCREDWLGVLSSTRMLFKNIVFLPIMSTSERFKDIAATIAKSGVKLVVFSAFSENWQFLAQEIKNQNPKIKVKIFWHGSNAMNIEDYDWERLNEIFSLLGSGVCDSIAFAKKSMYEQYKELGYNVEFIANTVSVKKPKEELAKEEGKKIGIYMSGNRWVKNVYNQLSAASLIKGATVDMVPLSKKDSDFARILKIAKITGEEDPIEHEEMLRRIASCDVVVYTTFVECAPILPLECLELGVPCVTGDNHHYWEDSPKLKSYLVEPKVDDPVAIAKRLEKCIEHKDEVIKLYKVWKKEYDKECAKLLKKFLEV